MKSSDKRISGRCIGNMARRESAAGTLPLAAAASSTIHDMSWIVDETGGFSQMTAKVF